MPTAWSTTTHTDKHPYAWLADNPWALELAQAHMTVQSEGRPLFFDALDFEKDFEKRFAQDTTSSTIFFVDVGGSTGTQSLALRQRYPASKEGFFSKIDQRSYSKRMRSLRALQILRQRYMISSRHRRKREPIMALEDHRPSVFVNTAMMHTANLVDALELPRPRRLLMWNVAGKDPVE
ncbi:hypothetical protein MGU_09122 [Metarhizium guizhouense ARSEF 977]|uniref:Uncharacterized protein n=1 Tax=Metarhizium guizhouense (strain ARSEF 977) TaxID=1276136 RepID=A0A0B4GA07_METGA|nr:hypothetical protein MGU_09122 [Metarhizium guizhouense ARSEF 977]